MTLESVWLFSEACLIIKMKVVDEDDGDEDDGVQDDGEGEWNSCQVKIESLWLLC